MKLIHWLYAILDPPKSDGNNLGKTKDGENDDDFYKITDSEVDDFYKTEDDQKDDHANDQGHDGHGIPHDHESVPNNGEGVPHDHDTGEGIPHSGERISHDHTNDQGLNHANDQEKDHSNDQGIDDANDQEHDHANDLPHEHVKFPGPDGKMISDINYDKGDNHANDHESVPNNNGEGIPHDHDSVPNNGEEISHDHESVSCHTVGGPNSGKHCVFPFIWNEKMFNGKFIV